ncbi:hypothetical protein [Amphritea sp. HPY]|uniref:hypothetical protein n=1 Tax=Amphritea sp. HPY TaxID=3421652 RepID=UPI003D7E528F
MMQTLMWGGCMARLKYLCVLILCCFLSVSSAFPGDQSVQVEVATSEVRFFNVRVYQEADKSWVLRGRITRSNKDIKVPVGKVKVIVLDERGRQSYMETSDYKPSFIHRKTDRASYFTVRLPRKVVTDKSTLKLSFTR